MRHLSLSFHNVIDVLCRQARTGRHRSQSCGQGRGASIGIRIGTTAVTRPRDLGHIAGVQVPGLMFQGAAQSAPQGDCLVIQFWPGMPLMVHEIVVAPPAAVVASCGLQSGVLIFKPDALEHLAGAGIGPIVFIKTLTPTLPAATSARASSAANFDLPTSSATTGNLTGGEDPDDLVTTIRNSRSGWSLLVPVLELLCSLLDESILSWNAPLRRSLRPWPSPLAVLSSKPVLFCEKNDHPMWRRRRKKGKPQLALSRTAPERRLVRR